MVFIGGGDNQKESDRSRPYLKYKFLDRITGLWCFTNFNRILKK